MLARLCSFAGSSARVLGGLHHIVVRQPRVLGWSWRAGAEQEGEEEEGHIRLVQMRLHLLELSPLYLNLE